MMLLHGGKLCIKPPAKKSVLSTPKKSKYTGQSKRNLQRKAHAIKTAKMSQFLKSTVPIQTYFQNQNNVARQSRNCASKFSSKNNMTRAIQQELEKKKKRKREGPARSTKGHKQKSGGAVKKRPRRLSRSSRKAAKAKSERKEPRLRKKPKKSWLVSTVRNRVELLRRRLRSCVRCSVGQSKKICYEICIQSWCACCQEPLKPLMARVLFHTIKLQKH